jgi:thiamine transport system substrate-binding protein
MRTRALRTNFISTTTISVIALGLAASLASCSLAGGDDDASDKEGTGEVVLLTHESFVLPDDLKAAFEEETGLTLTIKATGDAGTLTNKLVLTKDAPEGDVVFGVDNTYAGRALAEGVFADYRPDDLPAGVEDLTIEGDESLTPIDTGAVCLNIDTGWFADNEIAEPSTLDDLLKPAYKDLTVLPGAATSSPGMAFLLTTIAAKGDEWSAYWTSLLDNGAKLVEGWSDAYYTDFTAGGGGGDRPIVLSYDSSPAFTVTEGGAATTTKALLDTCFEQVEYAGVLAGAENAEGAEKLVDFLLTPEVQAALPDAMYVYPAATDTPLPEAWATFTTRPTDPWTVPADDIDEHRDEWLTQWSDVTSR